VIARKAGWYPAAVLITNRVLSGRNGTKLDLGDLTLLPAGHLQLTVTTADFSPLAPVHLAFVDQKEFPLTALSAGDSLPSLPESIRDALIGIHPTQPFELVDVPHPFPAGEPHCVVPAGPLRVRAWNDRHPIFNVGRKEGIEAEALRENLHPR